MRYSQIKNDVRHNLIDGVIVARIRNPNPPKRKSLSSGKRKKVYESDFRYVLIFVPANRKGAVPRATDYFLYRDSTKFKNYRRDFRALWTVSKTLADWGLRHFTFVDLAGKSDHEGAKDLVKMVRDLTNQYRLLEKALEDYPLSATEPPQWITQE